MQQARFQPYHVRGRQDFIQARSARHNSIEPVVGNRHDGRANRPRRHGEARINPGGKRYVGRRWAWRRRGGKRDHKAAARTMPVPAVVRARRHDDGAAGFPHFRRHARHVVIANEDKAPPRDKTDGHGSFLSASERKRIVEAVMCNT